MPDRPRIHESDIRGGMDTSSRPKQTGYYGQ